MKKLHLTISQVAAEWSALTGRSISESDILRIAADTGLPWVLIAQGIKLSLEDVMRHPALSLHAYIRHPIKVVDENGLPNGMFSGRIFIDCDQVAKIIKHGYITLNIGHDTDTMSILRFATPLKVRRGDLVVTAANKSQFEARFLLKDAK